MVAASSETDPTPSSADSQAGGPQKSASATEIATGAGNPLKKKIDRLISSKLHNDANFIKVIDYVGPLVDQLDIHIERRLRRQLEQREIELNKEYLKDFEQMNQNVQTFVGKVREMHRISSELTDRIQQNKDKTKDLLNKTSALQSHKRLLEAKQRAIDEFLDKFSISETERKALHGNPNDGTVSMEFFPALERVKTIYEQSKQLLRTSQDHSAAIEIMDEMGKLMSDAYITLQASASRECRLLSTDYSDVKGVLCRSLAVLQERYGLLKHTLDEYATGRKGYILKYYIDALIKGAHRNGRPIELMSHDSLRYIGDMLAWIYEAIESERELLQFMLKDCKPEAMQEHGTYVLSEISSALNAPLKTRVEQSMNAEQNCVILYRLSALFNFYAEKLSPIIGADSQLARTIVELNELALNLFFSSLSTAVRKLLTKMGAPDYDLLPVPAVHQVLLLLRDILDTHDGAMTSRSNAQEEFQQIFAHVLDPLHNAIQIAATHLHSPLDIAVYTLNCLTAINSLVTLYQFTDRRLEMLKASMEANEDVLVSEEASNILASTGLVEIYRKAAAHDTNQGPLSAIPSMDSASIMHAFNQFDSFLARPDSCRLDQVAKISSARIRDLVRSRTMENVIAAYSTIHRKLVDPSNKYENINYKSLEQVGFNRKLNFGDYLETVRYRNTRHRQE
ncbi:hypothetical protein WR25_08383 [Diploscapter pachys]|uniref:Conserved oligomeric Golgi complex subunit 6 n=1 Tax=Diploscapter pachys TaxID=2018661 RepID=A0A2A2JNY6_9BILA|nr:hypothetical protein WR25_08383 [Diploscapter pachys]